MINHWIGKLKRWVGAEPIARRGRRLWLGLVLGICLAFGIPALQGVAQSPDRAHNVNLQGQQQLEQGNPEAALQSWQQAETLYRQAGNTTGMIGTQLNQAKALQALGFFRRAKTLLEQGLPTLRSQPDSSLKANQLLTYGNLLRLLGDLKTSQQVLEQSLAIAQRLQSAPNLQAAQLHLGNTLLAQQNPQAALKQFEQAAAVPGALQISAQLHQLRLLPRLDRLGDAQGLLPQITAQLAASSDSTALYGQIELANLLPQLKPDAAALSAAQLLQSAAQRAKKLGDRRAESYAVGRLGHLYEQTQQWAIARQLTEQALGLARSLDVPEIMYQWQWQMGRILRAQGESAEAILIYSQSVESLQSLRTDLVAIQQEVQFSFREQVEPVYRELVDLLLQPTSDPNPQANLAQARQTIESLQLAELNNFFREACLDASPQPIDKIDKTAAVLYPILLRDRLEVILSLPGQPLRHYATPLSPAQIEAGVQQMQRSMRVTSFANERLVAAQQLYRWLVQPAEADLKALAIKTLVFVLDGSLRNVPMAALHTGTEYLIETYQIALAPSLQLLSPRTLQRDQIRALVGGLSESRADAPPLPGVQQEVDQISQEISAKVILNQAFTVQSLKHQVEAAPYTVVHLATHGQFSSQASETYIQTWDGRLDINALQALLSQRKESQTAAIELLVLSACQTAEGDNRAALGMAGIAVRSGARSTLATLWTVNDESTAIFITEFYKHLVQPSASKALAVRQAQIKLLKSQMFKHPYYWAPFILVGNWL
jgi:CHAT domain-containing protein